MTFYLLSNLSQRPMRQIYHSLHPCAKSWSGGIRDAAAVVKTFRPRFVIHYLVPCASSYPNVQKLIQVLCTIPVTTNTCERSFSKLKLLKTYLRSTMSTERLTSLALIYVQRELSETEEIAEGVIEIFSLRHPRRMTMNIENLVCSDKSVLFS